MLVNLNDILPKARRGHYAVGAFNTSNLEITQAIIQTAEALKAPVIVATSEKALQYAGIENLSSLIIGMAKRASVPVVLHLDHGSSFEIAQTCIRHGFTSVMIDASHLPYKENLRITRRVVGYAHKQKASIEAEIGRLAGIEDEIKVASHEALYTDPEEAYRFAQESECDALAIAIGTSHGAYKFKAKPKLRIDILKQIEKEVKIPLVLHGASGVKAKWINRVNHFGGKLVHARGVPDTLLKQAIEHGIAKINTDTDIRIAFTAGVREHLSNHPADFDPRAIIGSGRALIRAVIEERITTFGARGKA